MRVVLFRDLGTEAKISENRLKSTVTDISRKYGLRVEFLSVIIPDIIGDFHPIVKVNEGKAFEIESYDENNLEDILLTEMAGNPPISIEISSLSKHQAIEA